MSPRLSFVTDAMAENYYAVEAIHGRILAQFEELARRHAAHQHVNPLDALLVAMQVQTICPALQPPLVFTDSAPQPLQLTFELQPARSA